jgi:hypothetical protein
VDGARGVAGRRSGTDPAGALFGAAGVLDGTPFRADWVLAGAPFRAAEVPAGAVSFGLLGAAFTCPGREAA